MEFIPYSRKVNYYETDQMAIMHHTNYIRIFEEARLDLMEKADILYRDLEKKGIIIPVVDAYAKYFESLEYADEFEVIVKLTDFTGVRMEFDYEIRFKDSGKLSASGHTCHCFVSPEHRPISIRRKFPDIYEKFLAMMN